ncbi:MAG: D-aminoacyl-tRNA deacylase [Flavobacteriales bacterium]
MRAVIQRVRKASVSIENEPVGAIESGLLILLGVEDADTEEDVEWLAQKIAGMRIFSDDEGKMNRSLIDTQGRALIVSQFTLHASTKKGNRPSFIQAAKPDHAIPIYESFIQAMNALTPEPAATGRFGADMQVSLVNDGPVTIWMDTKNKA